jgi:hypothetical protein
MHGHFRAAYHKNIPEVTQLLFNLAYSDIMRTFDDIVNKLRWTGVSMEHLIVGTFDRVAGKIIEMPLPEFLVSKIPHHRARYLRRGLVYLWDRRRAAVAKPL